jgi:protein-tyrosine phosphatase
MSIKILFVCLGNICRSPLAEGLFIKHLKDRGLEGKYTADSCGTSGYHTGSAPDPRTRENALKNGLELKHLARQFRKDDFLDFDLILAMDGSNKRNILSLEPAIDSPLAPVYLMRDFDVQEKGAEVPDPYHGGPEGFQKVFDILERSTLHLLEELEGGFLKK